MNSKEDKYPLDFSPCNNNEHIDPWRGPDFSPYLDKVRDLYGQIRFLGLPSYKDTGKNISLKQLFVSPLFSNRRTTPEELNKPQDHPSIELIDALKDNPRLIILGDPGAGKSTLINWICDQLTIFGGSSLTKEIGRIIPIPMVLRDFVLQDNFDLEGLLNSFFNTNLGKLLEPSRDKFNKLLQSGQLFFLIDGLDEIPPIKRASVRFALWELWSSHPSCRCIMTSRIIGSEIVRFDYVPIKINHDTSYPKLSELNRHLNLERFIHKSNSTSKELTSSSISPSQKEDTISYKSESQDSPDTSTQDSKLIPHPASGLHFSIIPTLYVLPFNDDQLSRFALNWYLARETKVTAEKTATDLLTALRSQQSLLALARIPNLLTLMALIYRVHYELPNGRANLYAKISEAYLESIDKARKIHGTGTLNLTEKEHWLANVAFGMQCQRANRPEEPHQKKSTQNKDDNESRETLIDESSLLDTLSEIFNNSKNLSKEAAKIESLELLRVISERSGLLIPRGTSDTGEKYSFMHLSFQEYFAAQYLRSGILSPYWHRSKGRTSLQSIKSYVQDPVWSETLWLLFESLANDTSLGDSWSDFLLLKIFDPLLSDFKKNTEKPRNYKSSIGLLINLIHDPHAGLTMKTREKMVKLLWGIYIQNRTERHEQWTQKESWICSDLCRSNPYRLEILKWGLETEKRLKKEWLILGGVEKFSEWLPFLKLRNFKICSFWNVHFSPHDLRQLYEHKHITSIGIDLKKTSDLQTLDEMPQLEELVLTGGDECTPSLPKVLRGIKRLYLTRGWSKKPFPKMPQFPDLEEINIRSNTNVGSLEWLLDYPKLISIDISYSEKILNFDKLRALPNLKTINLLNIKPVTQLMRSQLSQLSNVTITLDNQQLNTI